MNREGLLKYNQEQKKSEEKAKIGNDAQTIVGSVRHISSLLNFLLMGNLTKCI